MEGPVTKQCDNCGLNISTRGAYCPRCSEKLEAVESSNDGDENEDVFECPEEGCERSFDTERGMRSHHGQVHGE